MLMGLLEVTGRHEFNKEKQLTAVKFIRPVPTMIKIITHIVICVDASVCFATFEQVGSITCYIVITTTLSQLFIVISD